MKVDFACSQTAQEMERERRLQQEQKGDWEGGEKNGKESAG
jgi:hypothetical protein